jgi:precorrin-2/cobalt-factor-2 C20-methyltransferase
MTGTVYGLGVGPGDPELITVKAERLLRSLSVIAYPVQDDGTSVARRIVQDLIGADVREIPIHTPMTGRGSAEVGYRRAASEMAPYLDEGRDVGVLCEGDPLFYGSFSHLFHRLAERYQVDVVPGVCSLTAVAAAAGVPLATRNDVLTVLPSTLSDERLLNGLASADTVAIIKVGRHLARIRALLDDLGLTGRALYIERASLAEQRVLSVAAIDASKAAYFSTILVQRKDHRA